MNLALDRYAENPIIDELVRWPPRRQRILQVRAASSIFRKPFIEVELEGGEVFQRHFMRQSFATDWAEAEVILRALTDIELLAEFRYTPIRDAQALTRRVLATRDECIAEVESMYTEGLYAQYLMQFGTDCKALPEAVEEKIAHATRQLQSRDPGV